MLKAVSWCRLNLPMPFLERLAGNIRPCVCKLASRSVGKRSRHGFQVSIGCMGQPEPGLRDTHREARTWARELKFPCGCVTLGQSHDKQSFESLMCLRFSAGATEAKMEHGGCPPQTYILLGRGLGLESLSQEF